MVTKAGYCKACGQGFIYKTLGGAPTKYCIRCAPRIRRMRTNARVKRHRAAAHMGIVNEQAPVKESFLCAEHHLIHPDYSRVAEYLASPEVRENIESLIASLDDDTKEFWRQKLMDAIS